MEEMNTYVFHSIFAVVPEDVVPDELIVVWEHIHLARGVDEYDARENLYRFFDDFGMRDPETCRVDSRPAWLKLSGIRQVLACEDLAWENKRGESAIEVSYLAYQIKYSDLATLSNGDTVLATLTRIERRLQRENSAIS
jgi:hypothetical protein